jgi:DNA-directed RNA polymerase subunit N (RpoN/RPB10)
MKLLVPPEFVKIQKSRAMTIPLQCECCSRTFLSSKKEVQTALADSGRNRLRFCSRECRTAWQTKKITLQCEVCGKSITRKRSAFMEHVYCSSSCAATVSNKSVNRTGIRRSKLETWLESKLTDNYRGFKFEWNTRKIIDGLELDIYIPALKLAFELNGIFHYEPVFGPEKLLKIQTRDKGKYQRCIEQNISLCVIDTTSMKYFKEDKAKVFLDIIAGIIDQKLAEGEGFEPSVGV